MTRISFLPAWVLISSIFLASCSGNQKQAEHATLDEAGLPAPTPVKVAYTLPETFRGKLQQITDAYLATKDALVASDPQAANTKVGDLIVGLQQADTTQLPKEAVAKWTEHRKIIDRAATTLQAAPKLEDKRIQFEALSKAMYLMIKDFGSDKTLYKEYCPMAMNDKGAFWLSAQSEIRNPFYGNKMLECGEVQEVLKFE